MLINNHELTTELIKQLKTASEDVAILVEGKNDERALRELGIEAKIFLLNINKSLVETSENLANRRFAGPSEPPFRLELAKWHQVILMPDSDNQAEQSSAWSR